MDAYNVCFVDVATDHKRLLPALSYLFDPAVERMRSILHRLLLEDYDILLRLNPATPRHLHSTPNRIHRQDGRRGP